MFSVCFQTLWRKTVSAILFEGEIALILSIADHIDSGNYFLSSILAPGILGLTRLKGNAVVIKKSASKIIREILHLHLVCLRDASDSFILITSSILCKLILKFIS